VCARTISQFCSGSLLFPVPIGSVTLLSLLALKLQLTWRGFLENSQAAALPKNVLSLGILMAQRSTGPFRLEIRGIYAIDANSLQKRYDGT